MSVRAVRLAAVACTLLGLVGLAACGDDDDAASRARAASGSGGADRGSGARLAGALAFNVVRFHAQGPAGRERDGGASADGGNRALGIDGGSAPQSPLVARGEYLVRNVAGCMECHTPRLPSGAFDERKLLSGVERFADVEPDDDSRGLVHTRNLTPDRKTGLGNWSDAQIERAFRHGVNDEGQVLHWLMPYWIFAGMRDEDAAAIVAYLRAIPAVLHAVPANQPNAVDMRKPYVAYVLPDGAVPHSTLAAGDPARASAERGRYLASGVAPCMLCHSPPQLNDPAVPLDPGRAFAGRRKLPAVKLGSGVLDAPLIDSFNLTPHETGLGGWSASDVADLLRHGLSPKGLPVCDPMPSYYGGTFRGLSARDAQDLGSYFTTIPPQDSGAIDPCCTACHADTMVDSDAGR